VKHWTTTLAILAAQCASLALAEDFRTINGKEYKNATVSSVEADGIVLKTKSGVSKVYFTELPKEVQQRFNYNPEKAAEYSANQNASLEQARKQQEQATQSPTQLSVQEDDKIKAIMSSTQPQRAEIGEEQMALIRNSDRYKRGYAKQSTAVKINVAAAERAFTDAESALHHELSKPVVKGLSAEYYDQRQSHFYLVVGADAQARDRLLDLYALIMKDGE
jgi:hypothetical protein